MRPSFCCRRPDVFVCATKGQFHDLLPHSAHRLIHLPAPAGELLCYFLKQIYITVITLCNSHAHPNTSSRPVPTPTRPHARVRTRVRGTHLVLLQGSLLLHVRTVFAGDNSFDISHRHCGEDTSEKNNNNNCDDCDIPRWGRMEGDWCV